MMANDLLLKNGFVVTGNGARKEDILIRNGRIAAMAPGLSAGEDVRIMDLTGLTLVPSFADVHVHLREPGQSYKETIFHDQDQFQPFIWLLTIPYS